MAALAPVRVPAGRQGGPRTTTPQAGATELQTDTTNHYKASQGPAEGPVLLASWVAVTRWWHGGHAGSPMFPLSAVLFPHASMPLHVFEPRYRVIWENLIDFE